ncbi:MAG: nuclear transport factor 2 family protein [Dehalococcoidia bacterium]
MDIEQLSRQVTLLQDIEAIKRLMADYCDIADDDHNQDRIVTIFDEDGIWEGEPHFARGHAEIRALFKMFAEQICFSQHNVFNPRIEVHGNTAHATHHFLGPFTYRESGQRTWIIARSVDDFVKVDGVWKIKHHRGIGIEALTEDGWPKSTPPEVFGNFGWRGPKTA